MIRITPASRCSSMGNNCPERNNCHRYVGYQLQFDDMPFAALNCRREAGASACDMWLPIELISTFKDE